MLNLRSKIYKRISDNTNEKSVATRLRRQRFQILLSIMEDMPDEVTILDIGGRPRYWEMMTEGLPLAHRLKLTLLNYEPTHLSSPSSEFTMLVGDGRKMPQFSDNQFDIVFSNSTIEHVGDFSDQQQMANEVRRIGRYYYVQTPNRYFPIEPHFVFPFFQFFPISLQALMIQHFDLGGYSKAPKWQDAVRKVSSIRLLNRLEIVQLFPEASIFEEKYYGFTKSYVAYTSKSK